MMSYFHNTRQIDAKINPQEVNIAIVIPCFRVGDQIKGVIEQIPDYIRTIIAINDSSPDDTGSVLDQLAKTEPRLIVIHHERNQGVGGATKSGFKEALRRDVDIVIKMDGDAQMDPVYIPVLVNPIINGQADYTKGNRFHDWRYASGMPLIRKVGNLGLSFMIKIASGYWNIFDPTNGYTAISASTLRRLDFDQLEERYLFEASMLIELYFLVAVIHQIPMKAIYLGAPSSLSVAKSLFEFPMFLTKALFRRFIRRYILQDFNAVTVLTFIGLINLSFGTLFGGYHWIRSVITQLPATAGTVILSAVPTMLGIQFLLQAVVLDIQNTPD